MCIKTISGKRLRAEFTFHEISALKRAASENIQPGEQFDGIGGPYEVKERNEELLTILRMPTNKMMTVSLVNGKKKDKEVEENNNNEKNNQITTTMDDSNNELMNAISVLKKFAENSKNNLDEAKVKEIVTAVVNSKIQELKTVTITVDKLSPVKIEETLHPKFKEVLIWAQNRIPVYLYGPAGTGKNVLCEQIAKSLGLKFYCQASIQQKYELDGFNDANGNYVPTPFYKAFTEGGVFLFDEIDGASPDVLVAINAIRSRYYNFPNVGLVHAHKDFIFLAAGNTKGHGKDNTYNGRYQLDASTLDGFAFINIDYDRNIELKCCNNNADLVDFFHIIRTKINELELPYTVTPRALKRVTIAELNGFDEKHALMSGLCGSWDSVDIDSIKQVLPTDRNKYLTAFKGI